MVNIIKPSVSRVESHYGNNLPQTGNSTSIFTIMGSMIASLGTWFAFKRKKD